MRGETIRRATAVPVLPYWGCSLAGRQGGYGRAKLFRDAMTWLWREHKDIRRVGVLVAGNDITNGASADAVRSAWVDFAAFWAAWDIELILLDVVPSSFHREAEELE